MNQNHKRVLAAHLAHIERNLDLTRSELINDATESSPVLYTVKRDVRQDAKVTILRDVSKMLNEIRLMKGLYELQGQSESSRRRVRGALLEIRDTVYDLRPKSLENYGSMGARDKEALESHLSRLLALVEGMGTIL